MARPETASPAPAIARQTRHVCVLLAIALLGGCIGPNASTSPHLASPETFTRAKVVSVQDGDTLTVLDRGQRVRIRLDQIDAPEKRQPYGMQSRASLTELCLDKPAVVRPSKTDRYGRTLADVDCDGVNVQREQLRRGLAWVYFHYARDVELFDLQTDARRAHIGLWTDEHPQPPWAFRHGE